MKKALFIVAGLFFFCLQDSFSQSWRLSTDTLKVPPAFGSGEGAIAFVNKYDTIPCKYKVEGDNQVHSGFKLVYKKNGFYVDDINTINVFFDDKRRRVNNVVAYSLEKLLDRS